MNKKRIKKKQEEREEPYFFEEEYPVLIVGHLRKLLISIGMKEIKNRGILI